MADTGKKVLFVITKSNWGGAQAYVYTLASHFKERGMAVAVALGGTGATGAPVGRLAEMLTAAEVRTILLPSFMRDISFSHEVRALFELYRTIRAERPDVLHVNSSKAGGLGALAGRLAGVRRIVFTSHGLAYDEDRARGARALIWLSTWATFLLCHRVIVISQDTYRRARGLPFCAHKIRLVPNGIAPQPLLERDEARCKLNESQLSGSGVWIGTIAELTRNKGLTYLIQAAALLKRRGHAFTLCIMGVGEDRIPLEALAQKEDVADRVCFLGFVAHGRRYLTAFDIFTLVSVKEGLPYVLLEAAQAKCAVVGTRIPGITDLVDDTTGVLVEPKNADAIARALEGLLADPERRRTLGQAFHDRVTTQFSLEHMLDGIVATYND